MNTPKVFISYAHSSEAHKQTVANLVAVLRARGLIVAVDADVKEPYGPEEQWPRWMKRQLAEADWVLLFFDKIYRRRFDGKEKPGKGRGASWEGLIITNEFYRNSGKNKRFVPLIANEAKDGLIPNELFGATCYRIPRQSDDLAMALLNRGSWEDYDGLFEFGKFKTAFLPSLNVNKRKFKPFSIFDISINRSSREYILPPEFADTLINTPDFDFPSCRLEHCVVSEGSKLDFSFSKIKYTDYLKSGEHLDDPLPGNPKRTFRQEFGQIAHLRERSLRDFALTNICGAGVFIVSKDNAILVTRHSPASHVYPNRWTFSSSGTLRWGAWPHPFTEAIAKCRHEINHQVDPARLKLVEFGADARKLFFECCFVEHSELNSEEIEANLLANPRIGFSKAKANFEFLPLSPVGEILNRIPTSCWEPAAEATLLTILAQQHGINKTLACVDELGEKWRRHRIIDEWDLRASKQGSLAVMSIRYPIERLEEESRRYVEAVMAFMGNDVFNAVILEPGSGIGRISERLGRVCRSLTCVDICERMVERNRERLAHLGEKVRFAIGFIQDSELLDTNYDVAVCSLILTHSAEKRDFETAIKNICERTKTVFVFEDVTKGRATSPFTRLRSKEEITAVFKTNNFKLVDSKDYSLFMDSMAFMKFRTTE
ncbi:MAG TPA: methyltransferase domain-containing protein [Verrucomicrobiae bacterium]|jgi:SAM-dependent methyltransferase|nr:methyltransferase domain-containing protein [Verrucomicrobiae bacterium]